MSPILSARGGLSSRAYGQFAASTAVPDLGAMFPLAMVQVGSGGSSSISFTSIPSTYKHLQVRISCSVSTNSDMWLTFNGDSTTSNYTSHFLWANGASTFSSAFGTAYGSYVGFSGSTTSFTGAVTDILDYGSTSKNKTVRTLAGTDTNGAGQIYFASGSWMNSSTAVTSISIAPISGTFNQYTQAALYGIKGA